MTALLDARGLTKRFPMRGAGGWLHAVDDVSLAIAPGECVGLVDESGCGTFVLRVIADALSQVAAVDIFH